MISIKYSNSALFVLLYVSLILHEGVYACACKCKDLEFDMI